MVDADQGQVGWRKGEELQFGNGLADLVEVMQRVLGQPVAAHDAYFLLQDAIANKRASEIASMYIEHKTT